jgi:hypothetical protein
VPFRRQQKIPLADEPPVPPARPPTLDPLSTDVSRPTSRPTNLSRPVAGPIVRPSKICPPCWWEFFSLYQKGSPPPPGILISFPPGIFSPPANSPVPPPVGWDQPAERAPAHHPLANHQLRCARPPQADKASLVTPYKSCPVPVSRVPSHSFTLAQSAGRGRGEGGF